MNGPTLSCTKCYSPLPPDFFQRAELAPCPACEAALQVEVFPALFKPVAVGKFGESIMVDGEASCFYHPQKRAVIPCAGCGRFLCAVCDVELNNQHICPACLEMGRQKGKLPQLENKRTLFDSAALSLALLPLLMWPVTLMTAPAAIIVAIYSWGKPGSLLPRTRIRSYLAILIAALQITGWTLLFMGIFSKRFKP
jgi:hypothetical protein